MTQNVCGHPSSETSIRKRLEHFTWPWFSCTMATGSLTIVLASIPTRFTGLDILCKILFLTDLVLFLTFTTLIVIRFILVPTQLVLSIQHPVEGLFFGTYWVSVALILNCTQLLGVPACGPWLVKALEILFWTYCATALLVSVFQYYIFFQDELLQVKDAVPAWIFPIYPLLVVGTMAGNFIDNQPPAAAWPIWVGGVMLQGLAWMVSIMVYTIYWQRLASSTLPSPSTRPGMYVSVGPTGYTAAGVLSLGSVSRKVLPPDAFNTTTLPAADVIEILAIMSGTFIGLLAFWFFCISTVAVLARVRQMSFTLNWWAFVFPNAGMALSLIQLGKVYQSPSINDVCNAVAIVLVALWIMTAIGHIKALWQGRTL